MASIYNLKSNIKIADLYKDLSEEQIKSIEKASSDGFTQEELKKLEEEGIDTSLIIQNSKEKDAKKASKSTDDVEKRAKEVKEKYLKGNYSGNGDKYTSSNPELQSLNAALDDGLIKILSNEGFTKTQIVNIISKAFPNIGIKANGEDGAYDRPYGHDEQAQKIYSRFSSHLAIASGLESKEIKAKRAELTSINNKIAYNNHEMQVLEVTIEALQEEIEEQIQEAIEESKDIQEETKKKAQNSVKKNLNAYTSSNGNMTYEEFKSGVDSDLKGIKTKSGRELSQVVNSLFDANYKMSLLKEYVSDLGDLNKDNQQLGEQALDTKSELDKLVDEAMENGSNDPQANCTDPIGFSSDSTRYDFFVDKDKNNDITNENEFLGAQNGFDEMKALDTDKDGKITASELESANVKVIQTNKDGTQKIINASDVFKNSMDGIDLNSYKNTNEDLQNGNKLLGTFNASINGQNLDGYQTLDTNDWLDKNYEFSDEKEGTGRFSQDISEIETAYDSTEKINIFTIKNKELESDLSKAWNAWGFSDEMSKNQINSLNSQAKNKGQAISDKFEKIAQKEKEVATWNEEEMAKDKENWEKLDNKDNETQDKKEDKDKKKEEE